MNTKKQKVSANQNNFDTNMFLTGILMSCGSYMSPPRDKTVCQTSPCKCKICISAIESDVYNKKKIQMFVVNMTFISSSEVKKNVYFMSAEYEIKVIFTPNI